VFREESAFSARRDPFEFRESGRGPIFGIDGPSLDVRIVVWRELKKSIGLFLNNQGSQDELRIEVDPSSCELISDLFPVLRDFGVDSLRAPRRKVLLKRAEIEANPQRLLL